LRLKVQWKPTVQELTLDMQSPPRDM